MDSPITKRIRKYLFDSLPMYFHLEDSYPDEEGKGTLERFFEVMESEFATPYQKIKNLWYLITPELSPLTHLFILGVNYGSPPKLFNYTNRYRSLLKGFRYLMSYKGTEKGLILLIKLLGGDCTIVDKTPEPVKYDDEKKFDNNERYDYVYKDFFFIEVSIETSEWDIPPSDDFIAELVDIIYFMLPINVFLETLTINGVEEGGFLLNESGKVLTTDNHYNLKANL